MFIVYTEHDQTNGHEETSSGAQELKVGSVLIGTDEGPSTFKIRGLFNTYKEARDYQQRRGWEKVPCVS